MSTPSDNKKWKHWGTTTAPPSKEFKPLVLETKTRGGAAAAGGGVNAARAALLGALSSSSSSGGGGGAAAPAAPRGGAGGGNYPGRSVGLPPIEPYVPSASAGAAAAAAAASPLLPLAPLHGWTPRAAFGRPPPRGVHFPAITKTFSGNGQLPINKRNYTGGNYKMSRFGFSSKRGSEHRAAAEGSGIYNGDPPSGGGAAAAGGAGGAAAAGGAGGGRPLIPRSYGTLNYRDSSYDGEGSGGKGAAGGAGGGGKPLRANLSTLPTAHANNVELRKERKTRRKNRRTRSR
jgi:hypothetical protein